MVKRKKDISFCVRRNVFSHVFRDSECTILLVTISHVSILDQISVVIFVTWPRNSVLSTIFFNIYTGIPLYHFILEQILNRGEYLLTMWDCYSWNFNRFISLQFSTSVSLIYGRMKSHLWKVKVYPPRTCYMEPFRLRCDGILGSITAGFDTTISSAFSSGEYSYLSNRLYDSLDDGRDFFVFQTSIYRDGGFFSDDRKVTWNR